MRYLILSVSLVFIVFSTVGCTTSTMPEKDEGAITSTLYKAAFSAEQSNDYKSAIQYYQKLLLRVPDDPDIVLALARNLRYSGAETAAVIILENSSEIDEDSPGYLIEYSKAKIALGKSEEAIAKLTKAVEHNPDNWEIHSLLGIAYDLVEDFSNAQLAYEKAITLSADNPVIYNNMAISAALSGNLDKAIHILNSVPRLTRSHPQLRQNLAFFYGIKGDVKSAEALARKDLDEEAVQQNLKIYSQFRAY